MVYDPADLPVALSLLEANGDGQYDDGTLPGLPYKISRPKPFRQPSEFELRPLRPLVLEQLRPY